MKTFTVAFIIFLLNGCSDKDIAGPSEIPISDLLAAPDTIIADNRQLTLSTNLWRDFMPGTNAGGSPLIATVSITAVDTAKFQYPVTADEIWVVFENKVWHSAFTTEDASGPEPRRNRITKIAREGPKWGPNVSVDVIVRVVDSKGIARLLRASKQIIGMTV